MLQFGINFIHVVNFSNIENVLLFSVMHVMICKIRIFVQERWTQGRNEMGTIPRVPNHCGGTKKSQQCHKYFLQYSTFASERHQIQIWGAKLASWPGSHLTSR